MVLENKKGDRYIYPPPFSLITGTKPEVVPFSGPYATRTVAEHSENLVTNILEYDIADDTARSIEQRTSDQTFRLKKSSQVNPH